MSERLIDVSDQGNDTTGDGSEAAPFRTGDRALVPPGAGGPDWNDHVTLRFKKGGHYPHFSLNRGGLSLLQPFRVTTYGEGPPPIVDSMNAQRGEPLNFSQVEGLDFRPGATSRSIGLEWRASGNIATIRDCSIQGFECGASFQSTDDATPNVFTGMLVYGLTVLNCGGLGVYVQGQKDISFLKPHIENIGSSQFHQGLYFNADNTSYSVISGFFRNIANCAIQARSGLMNIQNNTVLESGYGIAVGHGMSRTAGRGSITRNVVLAGKDRPDGGPLTCGIGVCMVDHHQGNPFLIKDNIIHSAMGGGRLGGISLGNDMATEYRNSDGALTRQMGHVLCEGNHVQGWPVGLRLVENYPGRMGITSNTFIANASLLMVNSSGWKGQGIRHFADYLSVSQIMQQNTWLEGTHMHLEEGGMPGSLNFPEGWRGGFDPGFSLIPPSDVPDFRDLDPTRPNYNEACRAKVGIS